MSFIRFTSLARLGIATAAVAMVCASANAVVTVLTFEGVGDLVPVGNFYNGGGGGNLGITFSDNSLGLVDADAGGSGNIGGEPSPSTVLFFLNGPAATMNVAGGFDTGFSFFYSSINVTGFVTVYDGPNATGNVLATLPLPTTPFNGAPDPTGAFSPLVPIGVAFSGTALSVDFGGSVNQIVFDDITLGSVNPGGGDVPEPGAIAFGIVAMGGVLGLVARKRKA